MPSSRQTILDVNNYGFFAILAKSCRVSTLIVVWWKRKHLSDWKKVHKRIKYDGSFKGWNFEHEIEAELSGQAPHEDGPLQNEQMTMTITDS